MGIHKITRIPCDIRVADCIEPLHLSCRCDSVYTNTQGIKKFLLTNIPCIEFTWALDSLCGCDDSAARSRSNTWSIKYLLALDIDRRRCQFSSGVKAIQRNLSLRTFYVSFKVTIPITPYNQLRVTDIERNRLFSSLNRQILISFTRRSSPQ